MRMAFVTTELAPWIKVGGLADVSTSLANTLSALGHTVQVLIPVTGVDCPPRSAGAVERKGSIGQSSLIWRSTRISNNFEVIWIGGAGFSDRDGGPYANSFGEEWPDGVLRYGHLCEILARAWIPQKNEWGPRPDLIHVHDWPTGLLPLWIHKLGIPIPTVLTIHNLAYQGLFPHEIFERLDLAPEFWRAEGGIEFYGSGSCLKAGLIFANRLTTVSPSYAREILTPAFGNGLEGVLRGRARDLTGILNGIDSDCWNPATDPLLPVRYDASDLTGKRYCREALIGQLDLSESSGPLAAFIGRLTEQKGIDRLVEIAPRLVSRGWRLVVLGRGTSDAEQRVADLSRHHPGAIRVLTEQSESWAHRIEAGADLFLMPSRFEPCGLSQQYSQRYGTLPIVHAVGGLRDTVQDADQDPCGTGFRFGPDTLESFFSTCVRAEQAWRTPERWIALQRRAMSIDFSWQRRVRAYIQIYEDLLSKRGQSPS
ncbi:MAG: glycogen synthase GlgA [Gammaproteobacteria bacterium]